MYLVYTFSGTSENPDPKRGMVCSASHMSTAHTRILQAIAHIIGERRQVTKEYVEFIEQPGGTGYYIAGSRVSLDSVVYAFLRGESPEGIVDSWPSLTLEQVFGALSFYLANREAVDQYLAEGAAGFRDLRDRLKRDQPALYARLAAARRETAPPLSPPAAIHTPA